MTETAAAADETAGAPQPDAYARGARVLSIGIASTGLFTFAYFAVASHVLDADPYGAVSLLWAVLFVVISVIYRPVEQRLRVRLGEEVVERALEARHEPAHDRVARAVLVVGVAGDRALGVARDRGSHSCTASRSSVLP